MAAIAVCIFVVLAFVTNSTGRLNPNSLPTQSESLSISRFHSVQGTSVFVATITNDSERSTNSSARTFRLDYAVPNLVFLDGDTLSSHTLFETNDNTILGLSQFPPPDPNGDVEVKWLVYEVATQDTNSDGAVNSKDRFSISVSGVSGLNYAELIVNVGGTYGMDLLGSQVLLLVYETTEGYRVSKIDLEQQIILETQVLTQIPLEKMP